MSKPKSLVSLGPMPNADIIKLKVYYLMVLKSIKDQLSYVY
jgi:hypothetical protein